MKKILFAILLLPALAAAQYYPGQLVKAHAHSNSGQGGRLTALDFLFSNQQNGATLTNVGVIRSSNTWSANGGGMYAPYEIRFSTIQGATGNQMISISTGVPASAENDYFYRHGCVGTGLCWLPQSENSYFSIAKVGAPPGGGVIEQATNLGQYAFTVQANSGDVWSDGVYHGDGSGLIGISGQDGLLYRDNDGNLTPVITAVTDTWLETVDSGDIQPK